MPNTIKNNVPGSVMTPPINPYMIRMPHTDWGGIMDVATPALNTKLALGGSYLKNLSTDTFSADLRLPIVPVVTTTAGGDQCNVEINGLDQFGRPASDLLVKVSNNQTDGCGSVAFSKITSVYMRAGTTTRLRLGMCYSNRTKLVTDLDKQVVVVTQIGTTRKLPLPFIPKSASSVQIRFIGTDPSGATILTSSPVAGTLTFTATDVQTTGWTLTAVAAGDIAYTLDGYAGIVASTTSTTTVTVTGWFKEGVAGTPANVTGAAGNPPWITIVRFPVASYNTTSTTQVSGYSVTNGGMIPGHKILPLVGTGLPRLCDIAGVDLRYATYGFMPSLGSESPFDLLFEANWQVGNAY